MTRLEKLLMVAAILLFSFVVIMPMTYNQKELCLSRGGTAVETNGHFERCIK